MISPGFLLMSKAGIGDTVSGVFSVSSQVALGALKKMKAIMIFCQILFSKELTLFRCAIIAFNLSRSLSNECSN